MVLKYEISKYLELHENMVVRIWEAESDGVNGWVYEQVIPERNSAGVPTPGAGHQVETTITVNGLDRVPHIVRLYSAISANKIHEYNVEPMSDKLIIYDPITFKVGDNGDDTPAANSNEFISGLIYLLKATDYTIFRNGYGYLLPGVHYMAYEISSSNGGAGSFILNPPDTFNDGEEFIIQRKPISGSVVVNDSVVGKLFKGFTDIVADTTYSPAHLRTLLRFAGSCSYTFAGTDVIPKGYLFAFTHLGTFTGAKGIGTIKFNNGSLLWGNTTKNAFDLASYQEAAFSFDGTHWNVIALSDSAFANTVIVPNAPNTIIAAGVVLIGDVPGGDPVYYVQHNKNIVGDYIVTLDIKTNNPANYSRNNKVCSTWWHDGADKPNKFNFSLQEISAEAEDLSVSWMIIKL